MIRGDSQSLFDVSRCTCPVPGEAMPAFQVRCPTCQALLRPTAPPGSTIRCPACKDTFKLRADPEPPPRKKRPVEEDSDPDIRPARRKKKRDDPAGNKALPWVLGGVGVLALLVGGVLIAVNAGGKSDDNRVAQAPPPAPPVPLPDPVGLGGLPPQRPPAGEDAGTAPVIRVP